VRDLNEYKQTLEYYDWVFVKEFLVDEFCKEFEIGPYGKHKYENDDPEFDDIFYHVFGPEAINPTGQYITYNLGLEYDILVELDNNFSPQERDIIIYVMEKLRTKIDNRYITINFYLPVDPFDMDY